MKRIKSTRHFVSGIITTILAAACFIAIPFKGFEPRYLVAGIFLIAWSATNYFFAFSKKGMSENILGGADERDRYITMKSGKMTLQILNYILCGACLISVILYGMLQLPVFVTVAATLCGVLIVLFIVMLCVNVYYEKHE